MLQQHLFIGTTRERCRDFVRQFNQPGLVHAYTLSEFVHTVFDSSRANLRFKSASSLEKQVLIRSVIQSSDLNYFSYLKESTEKYFNTLDTLLNFFHLLAVNETDISSFDYPEAKEKDLRTIFEGYQQAMHDRDYVDYADKIDFVLATVESRIAEAYETISVGSFEIDEIHLGNSKKEKRLIEKLGLCPVSGVFPSINAQKSAQINFNRVFNRRDEIAETARIVRSLLKKGVPAAEIVIAAGNIESYEGFLFETMDQYQIPLFVSKGVPLKHNRIFNDFNRALDQAESITDLRQFFKSRTSSLNRTRFDDDPLLSQALQFNRAALKTIHEIYNQCEFLGLTLAEVRGHFKQSVKDEPVVVVNRGIQFQELNQLIFRNFKHLILVGVDSELLPPVPAGNYLYEPCQLEEIFGQNNSYLLSRFHLNQVISRSENLYVVSARNDGGKPLEVSQLLLDLVPSLEGCNPFQTDPAILNRDDLLNEGKRTQLDSNSEAFIQSTQNEDFTHYDGLLSHFSHSISHLSASQLNTYATCPLKYFFDKILRLEAPSDKSAGFETFEVGSIMHSVLERFSNDVLKKNFVLPEKLDDSVRKHILGITETVYRDMLQKINTAENIYHRMVFKDLTRGLQADEEPGAIRTFLDYIYDPEDETHFKLQNLEGVEHEILAKDYQIGAVPISGFIDRIDTQPEFVRLIDYKSTKSPKESDIVQKIKDLKEFQLPLYLMYARDQIAKTTNQTIKAFLFSLPAKKEYARIEYRDGKVTFRYRANRKDIEEEIDGFLDRVEERIVEINSCIHAGKFSFCLDEEGCEYCNFTTLCHKAVLDKGAA